MVAHFMLCSTGQARAPLLTYLDRNSNVPNDTKENLFLAGSPDGRLVSLRTPDEPVEVPSADSPPAADIAVDTAVDMAAAAASPPAAVGGPAIPTASAVAAHRPIVRLQLTGGLLHDWQRRNAAASMPLALSQLATAGNLDNLRLAIRAGADAGPDGDGEGARPVRPWRLGPVDPIPGLGYRGPVFMDSDIYKTLEAIGWELANGPRPELASFAAEATALLEEAQRPDGYLN